MGASALARGNYYGEPDEPVRAGSASSVVVRGLLCGKWWTVNELMEELGASRISVKAAIRTLSMREIVFARKDRTTFYKQKRYRIFARAWNIKAAAVREVRK